jgi:signal transduction histidine kinase/CheY-like chemotaxis protein/HAMP domain-containing protein
MEVKVELKKSLSRKYATMMIASIGFFLIGTATLWLSLHHFEESYSQEINELEKKELLAQEIMQSYNNAFSNARGYFAYGNPILKENVLINGKKVILLLQRFAEVATTDEDDRFLTDAEEFKSYYFDETIPYSFSKYESGQLDVVAKLANTVTTARITSFQGDSERYISGVGKQLEASFDRLITLQIYAQFAYILFILLIMLTILRITRIMFRRVGQPLGQLAMVANDLANGKEALIDILDMSRDDELGSLSIAFRKMVETLKEKEKHLLSQNEELLTHQDELQYQKIELEETLATLKNNEWKLKKRNEMINKISSSLNKQDVLDSIVINMCKIIEADCGMMILLKEGSQSAYGVSSSGMDQFKENILNGLSERLLIDKEPFMIKRELGIRDKGYHQHTTYSYDLYLPIMSSDDEVVAFLVFSRFGVPFPHSDMDEYMALTRNIAIFLEKIKLYEKSVEDGRLNQDILNTIHEGIQLIDHQGKIIQVNKQLVDMFDWGNGEIDELVGLEWTEWTSTMTREVDEVEPFKEFLQNALLINDKETIRQNTYTYKKDNPFLVVKVYCEVLYHGKEKVGTVFVHRDITKEFEVDQIKSEFVSTVSHELRTPLASILGFTELMLNRELKPDRQQKYVSTIYNEARRLTALINDFLDVQRMEAGKQTYEKKFINLKPIMEKVMDAQKISTSQHHIYLVDECEEGLILGDRDKMEQVFTNLLNNAIKYSPKGGDIEIKLYTQEDRICVDIKDQGLGIPKESMKMLFSKFYRIDNSDRKRIGGTGLGLAIVQEIMKAHNGEVSVHSTYGVGSTFTCSFPLIPAQSELESYVGPKGMGYKVLVVEDDQSLGQLISQELKESFQVVYFKKGLDALDYLKREIPDALVLDILLEEDEIDGWGIMEQIKNQEHLKNIPIFVSSALDEKEKGISLGATDYLVKPYKPSQLSKVIMQSLLKVGKVGQVYIPQEVLLEEDLD